MHVADGIVHAWRTAGRKPGDSAIERPVKGELSPLSVPSIPYLQGSVFRSAVGRRQRVDFDIGPPIPLWVLVRAQDSVGLKMGSPHSIRRSSATFRCRWRVCPRRVGLMMSSSDGSASGGERVMPGQIASCVGRSGSGQQLRVELSVVA